MTTTLQKLAGVFGVIFIVVAVLGFISPGGMAMAMEPTTGMVLGIFPVNLLHNIVHLVIGIAGIAAAGSLARSRQFCQVFGVVLILIGVVGIFVNNPLSLIPIGGFDVVIHLVTGGILSYFGFVRATQPRPAVA